MARTNEEWAALLGSTLCKMARVHGTDAPNAYLPEECYPVIEKTFEVALKEARAEGHAAAMREMQVNRPSRAATPDHDRPVHADHSAYPAHRLTGAMQLPFVNPVESARQHTQN